MDLGSTTGMDLSNITLFDGSRRGPDYHSWAAAPEREVTKQVNQARSAGRTVDAVDRLDMAEKYLQHDSEAYTSFSSLRKICSWRLDAASENCFTDYNPTQEELAFVLGMSVNVPGLKEGITSILKKEFSDAYVRAHHKGWVRTETQMLAQATQEILGRQAAAPATPAASAQTSSSADATSSAEGEATPARAAAVPENRMFVSDGKRSDPNTYAYKNVMHLFGLKYSQATYEQEAAFNTLAQGNSTEEVFANELQRQAAAMRHKPDLNERTIIMRFVNGLNDTALAADLLQWLQNADSKVTMKDVMLRVAQYKDTLKELTLVRVQAEAAKALSQQSMGFDRSALLAKAPGEKSSNGNNSGSSLAPKKQMLEAAKACVLSGQYTPDHVPG